jgi:hypothetical protein
MDTPNRGFGQNQKSVYLLLQMQKWALVKRQFEWSSSRFNPI